MKAQEISEIIKTLSETIGIASSEIVPHYAKWTIAASIGYMFCAVCIFVGSLVVFKLFCKNAEDSEYDKDSWRAMAWVVMVCGFLISIFMFSSQIGDLISPTGMAIHSLIRDVRG